MTWIAIAIATHAVVLAVIEYFRATHIDLGGPYRVSGLDFVKQPGYWKYRLCKQYGHTWTKEPQLGENFREDGKLEHAGVTETAVLLSKGYAWDGSSGPAKDTWTGMRASALHDVWCQAMAKRVYARGLHNWRIGAREYRLACIADHMPKWRAWVRFFFVLVYGRLKYRHHQS